MSDFFSTKYFPWQNLVWFLSVVHKTTAYDMLYFRKLQGDVFMFVFFFHSICQEGKKNASVFYFFSTSEI